MNDRAASHAHDLRRRAQHLVELARSIEASIVMSLPDRLGEIPPGPRRELCEQLVERQLHQLHRAADGLRTTAFRLRTRADELDAAAATFGAA